MKEIEFFELRSNLLGLLEKFKEVCEQQDRNFKEEVDEVFFEVDEA